MYRYFFKRVLDILLSLCGIIVLALPMLVIAIVIKCDDKGPALFKQERTGKNGKPFKFYKFRSMKMNAPHEEATRNIDGAKYITKVGGFLRKTSLDELPQMFCILKGDMSIIGPRPVVMTETELINYRKEFGALAVRPGLTGLAQVKKRDNLTDMKLKAQIDGEYANHITFIGDLKIFFKTIVKVLKQDDVVEGGEKADNEIEALDCTVEKNEQESNIETEAQQIVEAVINETKPDKSVG